MSLSLINWFLYHRSIPYWFIFNTLPWNCLIFKFDILILIILIHLFDIFWAKSRRNIIEYLRINIFIWKCVNLKLVMTWSNALLLNFFIVYVLFIQRIFVIISMAIKKRFQIKSSLCIFMVDHLKTLIDILNMNCNSSLLFSGYINLFNLWFLSLCLKNIFYFLSFLFQILVLLTFWSFTLLISLNFIQSLW